MKHAAALLIAIAALAAPASAIAAPQLAAPMPTVRVAQVPVNSSVPANAGPDHRALYAYASYLAALMAAAPTAQAGATSYVATISSPNGCKSALEPLTLPSNQVNTSAQHTLTMLGQEMGDDLSITFDQAALPAFTRFSNTLLRLHWARSSGALQVVKRYVNAETDVLEMLPSDLCQDAALAGTYSDKVPEGTRLFVHSYDRASTSANVALANLLKMMQSYEIPGEKGLINRIATLAGEVASVTKSDLLTSGYALSNVLEAS